MPKRYDAQKIGRVTIYRRKPGGPWWAGYSAPGGATNHTLDLSNKELAQK